MELNIVKTLYFHAVFCHMVVKIVGFNLDVQNIIELKRNNYQNGSYFGYSMAFYVDRFNR